MVAEAIRSEAESLRKGLRDVGYATAEVQVSVWDGDRLKALSQVMKRYAGMDAEA